MSKPKVGEIRVMERDGVFEGENLAPFAIVIFNLKSAETVDDAAVERLTQECVHWLGKRVTKRKLSNVDVMCAVQEIAARIHMAPVLQDRDRARVEKLANDMATVMVKRMISVWEGFAPGAAEADGLEQVQ